MTPLNLSPFFFFNDPSSSEIYTLPLHDALPFCPQRVIARAAAVGAQVEGLARRHVHHPVVVERRDGAHAERPRLHRKSTRLDSSHLVISYVVLCFERSTVLR